jgi:hypothetical protein
MSKLQEKPSALKTQHPPLQTRKFFSFFCFIGHFTLLDSDPDPDPHSQYTPDQSQSGSMWIRIPIQIHNTACKVKSSKSPEGPDAGRSKE